MRILHLGTYVVTSCVAAATLAGCGDLPSDSAQAAANPQGRASEAHVNRRGSWMLPNARRGDLLYISDAKSADVYVYTLPGLKLSGTLADFTYPAGECSDSRGNVWITDASRIVEYAHGGTTPISVLSDPNTYAANCSVDPSSGNLAVTNLFTVGSGQGSVAIYRGASGSPALYQDSSMYYVYFCGYSNVGNLYVDGMSSAGAFVFAELPKGSSTFTNITLNVPIAFPGSVQWDGHHMTTTPQAPTHNAIYRLEIAGSAGSVIGESRLKPSSCVPAQTWIAGAIVASSCLELSGGSTIDLWRYPNGGRPIESGSGSSQPAGTTISLAPR
jgi:hypothetical protein